MVSISISIPVSVAEPLLKTRVSLMLPDERVRDILPDTPGDGTAALPEYASLFDAPLPRYAEAGQMPDHRRELMPADVIRGVSDRFPPPITGAASPEATMAPARLAGRTANPACVVDFHALADSL